MHIYKGGGRTLLKSAFYLVALRPDPKLTAMERLMLEKTEKKIIKNEVQVCGVLSLSFSTSICLLLFLWHLK